jgi:hypothetical protein
VRRRLPGQPRAGLIAVDRVHPQRTAGRRTWGRCSPALGLLAGLIDAGALGSAWLPLALIAVGVALLWRNRGGAAFPPPRRSVPTPPPVPPSGSVQDTAGQDETLPERDTR